MAGRAGPILVRPISQLLYGGDITRERLLIRERDSAVAELGDIIVTATQTFTDRVELVVGRPGLPSLTQMLSVGAAVLYETPEGVFEVRVLSTTSIQATVLVSHVARRPGIAAGFVDDNQANEPFAIDERARLSISINEIHLAMAERDDIAPEQLAFIANKLTDMEAAADRMGKKDWINLAIGTLTSTVVTIALDPVAAKALFLAADSALAWLLAGEMRLLP